MSYNFITFLSIFLYELFSLKSLFAENVFTYVYFRGETLQ